MQLQIVMLPLLFLACLTIGDEGGHGHDDYEYSPYHYEYKVHDKEYLDFGQEEEDDGKGNVHGYYHVQLPDGRHQRVDYHVSGYSGYIADVKYDGQANHPNYHGHHSSGHNGRHGKSLSFDEQPIVDSDQFGSKDGRQGKSLSFDELPSYSKTGNDLESFGRQGKSLDFDAKTTELSESATHSASRPLESDHDNFGHHNSGFFGSIDRQSKSLDFENNSADDTKSETHPSSSHFGSAQNSFGNHDSGNFGSFGRQGKSFGFERKPADENKFATHSGSSHIGSHQESFGSHGSLSRQGKSLDIESNKQTEKKKKKKKSNLISRKRIERSGVLETSASEQIKTSHQNTFFEFAPKNVKSPFPSNIHDQLRLRTEKNIWNIQKEQEELQKSQKNIQNIQHIPQEVQGLQNSHKEIQTLQKIQEETERLLEAQTQIQNLQNIHKEVELQSAPRHIKSLKADHHSGTQDLVVQQQTVQTDTFYRPVPHNVIKDQHQGEIENTQSQKGFLPVIRGKIIYAP